MSKVNLIGVCGCLLVCLRQGENGHVFVVISVQLAPGWTVDGLSGTTCLLYAQ